jgi:E-phenylitaconyl-CoA hydratase
MNSLSLRSFDEIDQVCSEFNDDPAARVMIVTGAGERAFSSGVDLKERNELNKDGAVGFNEFTKSRDWTRYGFMQAKKPVIAAINGYCLAGGLEMSLACDIRIAADNALFGLPEPRVGIVPAVGLVYLPRFIPMGEAMYILLTGERINAQEAYRIGLVHQVVPLADLMASAIKIAEQIVACAPLSVQAIKQTVQQTAYVPPELGSRLLNNLVGSVVETEDATEGPRAFTEKRKPIWKGR